MKDDVKPETSSETEELKAILAGAAKPRARWGLRFFGLAFVAGLAYGAYVWSSHGTTVSYTTSQLKPGDLTVIVTATGSVEPTVQVDVSSEQSGTVREVLVDYNSEVKKGDVLARLDTDKLSADLRVQSASRRAIGQGKARPTDDAGHEPRLDTAGSRHGRILLPGGLRGARKCRGRCDLCGSSPRTGKALARQGNDRFPQ